MAKPVHSMIRVLEGDRSVDFYRRAFGLEIKDKLAFDGFALIYLRHPTESDFEVELTVNHAQETSYDLGDGYGHLAVTVDDLDAEHARMTADGLAVGDLKEFSHNGQPFARFFFVTDPDGYKIEVIARGGRFL